jgi:hypothetical protein
VALGDPYVTTALLKTRLGIGDSADDTAIGEAVLTASRDIEKFCGRQFNKTTSASARVFYPETCHLAIVDDFHTTTDLVIKTDAGDDGTFETTWAATDYQLEPVNQIVDGESGWPYHRIRTRSSGATYFPQTGRGAPLQVTAQWGWNAVPAAVTTAAYLLASDYLKLKDANFGVAGMGEFGPMRVRENQRVSALLAPYRLYPVLVG